MKLCGRSRRSGRRLLTHPPAQAPAAPFTGSSPNWSSRSPLPPGPLMDSSATRRSREFAKTRNQPRSRGSCPPRIPGLPKINPQAINDQTTKPWHAPCLESRPRFRACRCLRRRAAHASRSRLLPRRTDHQARPGRATTPPSLPSSCPTSRAGRFRWCAARTGDVSRASSRNTWAKPCPGRYAGSPSRNRARAPPPPTSPSTISRG